MMRTKRHRATKKAPKRAQCGLPHPISDSREPGYGSAIASCAQPTVCSSPRLHCPKTTRNTALRPFHFPQSLLHFPSLRQNLSHFCRVPPQIHPRSVQAFSRPSTVHSQNRQIRPLTFSCCFWHSSIKRKVRGLFLAFAGFSWLPLQQRACLFSHRPLCDESLLLRFPCISRRHRQKQASIPPATSPRPVLDMFLTSS